jgi:lipoate-protein ligase A
MEVRLIDDAAGSASWNMAVDHVLLESAAHAASLRFYGWTPAALSLGYFQPASDRAAHPPSLDLDMVRRPTGGGALVHDKELTYCLAYPVIDRFRAAESLVGEIHEALLASLTDWGIAASVCPPNTSNSPVEPFLCFQRRAHGDVLLDGEKIAGSAQRRQRGSALVHGSVLLEASLFAPQLPGIAEISGKPVNTSQLAASWAAKLALRFGWRLASASLEPAEIASAKRVQRDKFGCPAWTKKR